MCSLPLTHPTFNLLFLPGSKPPYCKTCVEYKTRWLRTCNSPWTLLNTLVVKQVWRTCESPTCIVSSPRLILNVNRLQEEVAYGPEGCVSFGVRLLTNLGSGDFLLIAESLVFSCLGIIRWWRDIMRRWIPDPISAGYYRCHPCPWLLSLVLNYPLKLPPPFSLFFWPPPLPCSQRVSFVLHTPFPHQHCHSTRRPHLCA